MTKAVIPVERIEGVILLIREEKVILDYDLAKLYGVSTKALNQAVKRNQGRFPADFTFRLTQEEKDGVVTNCDHLSNLQFSPSLPNAFTEHGTIMVANMLNSQKAVDVSIFVVRAFIRLRRTLLAQEELARKMDELERRIEGHDENIKSIVTAIRQLITPEKRGKNPIGFHWEEKRAIAKPAKKQAPAKRKTPAKPGNNHKERSAGVI